MEMENRESACKVKLKNGEIVYYDLCGKSKNDYTSVENKEYLGKGTIYEINGVRQSFTEVERFWRFK